jgi:hypothetical protein
MARRSVIARTADGLAQNAAPHAIDQAARIAEERALQHRQREPHDQRLAAAAVPRPAQSSPFDLSLGERTIETSKPAACLQGGARRSSAPRAATIRRVGVLWVDPGRVIRSSSARTTDAAVGHHGDTSRAPAGIWVPARMKEIYKSAAERVEGTATYAKYRQFKIETIEIIK